MFVKTSAAIKLFFIVLAGLFTATSANAQYTATWALTSNNTNTSVTGAQAASVIVNDMEPGTEFIANAANNTSGFVSKIAEADWPTVATDGYNIDLPLSPAAGSDLTITGLTFTVKTSGSSGNSMAGLAYQVDGAGPFVSFGTPQALPSGGTNNINFGTLSQTFFNTHTYTVRLYIYASGTITNSRTVTIKNVAFTGMVITPAGIAPTITTDSAGSVTKYSAIGYGTITAGTIPPVSSGIAWGLNVNPSITDNVVNSNPLVSAGPLSALITGLSASTPYHIRAFVTTQAGTVYGSDVSFTTSAPTIPALTTVDPNTFTIFPRTTTSGGVITDSGGVAITAKGIVFNTTGNPQYPGDNPTSDGQFATNYSSALKNLQPSTLYYVNSYAINSVGVGYGTPITFTTAPPAAEILVNLSSLSFGPVIENNSSVQSFIVSGDILSPAADNITVTAPAGFQVSLTNGAGYASSVTIPYSNSAFANTTVYVKFTPTSVSDINGTITITGGTAPDESVSVDGTGIEPPGNFTNKGTDFWTGYATHNLMYDDATTLASNGGDQTMVLYFTSDVNANVTVSIPDLGMTFPPVAVTANTVQIFTVPKSTGGTLPPNVIQLYREGYFNSGIHITSDQPIVAYAHIFGKFVSGASLLLPTKTWSTDYYAVSTPQITSSSSGTNTGSYNYFFVVAKDDNTTIEITPTVNTYGGTDSSDEAPMIAGQTYTKTLKRGQIYNLLAVKNNVNSFVNITGAEDVTGSHIKTTDCTKTIAVFSGSGRTGVAPYCSGSNPSSDNLFAQVFPSVAWGQEYLTSPTVGTVPANVFRICVKDTSANITLNGVALNKTSPTTVGNVTVSALTNNFYYEYSDSVPDKIVSDKPSMVAQYCESVSGCSNTSGDVSGDPEMIFISPVQQAISNATLYCPNNQNISFDYINVVIPKAGVNSFTLDGVNMAYKFQQHPQDSGYYYAALDSVNGAPIQTGTHTLNDSIAFNAIVYGFGNAHNSSGGDQIRESYGYNAGAQIRDLSSQLIIQNPYGNPINSATNMLTTCKGTSFKVSATLPYQTNRITFSFFSNPDISPNNDTTIQATSGNIPFDSSYLLNGTTYYIYKLPTPYTFDAGGDYPVQITSFDPTSDAGCPGGSDKTISYTIHVVDGINTNFGITYNSCASDTVQLTDQSISTGHSVVAWTWTYNNNTTPLPAPADTVQNPKFANPADNVGANFTLRAVNDIGCFSDKTNPLPTTQNPQPTLNPFPSVCANTAPFLLTGGSPLNGVYSDIHNAITNGIFDPKTAGAGVDTIIYTIAAGCGQSVRKSITVDPSDTLLITSPTASLCVNSGQVPLTANVTGGSFLVDGQASNNTFDPATIGVGSHTIIYSVGGGCTLPDTLIVAVNDTAVINAGGPDLVAPVTINATGEGVSYAWSPATGLNNANILDPLASPLQTTLYLLTVTNSANCVSHDTVTVNVNIPCLHPSRAFTPNGDGYNDKWSVLDIGCAQVSVNVYNRWGSLVYHSDSYQNDWDGKYKGNTVPDGTYYYVVQALYQGRSQTFTGNVTILR